MDYRHLVPKKGVRVPDPATRRPLPEEGAMKPLNTYWHRRLAAGDVSVREEKKSRKSAVQPTADGQGPSTSSTSSGQAISGQGDK